MYGFLNMDKEYLMEEEIRALQLELNRKAEQVKELLTKCAEMKQEIAELKEQLNGRNSA